ncbi:type I phosphodiesterase/nucleotide pyrophosphatase [Achlya hypogyna]|uniref:Type I phosphodiesterase/nucleotide pyrophosphatase n=1 Tax=Achlya hypogyna TaxID=1202772 RepID=A0A1V9YG33_ACHHY|nr:type I phosphodiesterase/nucleotide pyrophosphatase [Achlya hypogyna]
MQLFAFVLALLPAFAIEVMAGIGYGLAQHVVVFGLDGLDVRCLHQALDSGLAPHMHYLRSHGMYTDNARNNRPAVSLPNWATIFYGANVMFHGVTSNDWSYCSGQTSSFLPSCVVYPDLFSVTKQQHPDATTAMFYTWAGLDAILPATAVDIDVHTYVAADETCNATLNASSIASAAAVDLISGGNRSSMPEVLFLYLGEADACAHEAGCFSDVGQSAIAAMDDHVGTIVQAVKAAGLFNSTLFFLVSDHGRNDDGVDHGDAAPSNEHVQWAVFGHGLAGGNRELKAAISIEDTAPTIAHALGYPAPLEWHGRVVHEVFLGANESLYAAAKSPWNQCLMNTCATGGTGSAGSESPGLADINWSLGLGSTAVLVLAIGLALLVRFYSPRREYEAI